ncbi:MAG: helix-turn-helix transcriptional regulator [Candidatus Absconditicoccaceae bacterium]
MQNRIKELRAKHHLTQQQLAEKVGVRRETIVFLEMGKYNPSLKLAWQIAQLFQCPIEEVFFFDEECPA